MVLIVQLNCPVCDPVLQMAQGREGLTVLWLKRWGDSLQEEPTEDTVFALFDAPFGGDHIGFTTKRDVPVVPFLIMDDGRRYGGVIVEEVLVG